MSRFVVDASIVLTWCFPDENTALAQHVADRFRNGDTALAPAFWPHEVLNALLAGEKRNRISMVMIRKFLDDLGTLPVMLEQFPAEIVFDRIQLLCRIHGLTAYDAAYLDLALENKLPLATLDKALVNACRDAGAAMVRVSR